MRQTTRRSIIWGRLQSENPWNQSLGYDYAGSILSLKGAPSLDCEQSLFFFGIVEGSARFRFRKRRAASGERRRTRAQAREVKITSLFLLSSGLCPRSSRLTVSPSQIARSPPLSQRKKKRLLAVYTVTHCHAILSYSVCFQVLLLILMSFNRV